MTLSTPSIYVFHRKGKPIRNFYATWRIACNKAGVPNRIRMTFGAQLCVTWNAQAYLDLAMKLTGHLIESVYRRYAIVCEADFAGGLKKLARLQEFEVKKLKQLQNRCALWD
jgi:hypothetical protein